MDDAPSSCGSGVMGLGSGGRGLERAPPPVATAGGLPAWLEEPPPVVVVAPFLVLVSSMSRGRLASRKECSFFLLSLALRGGSSPSSSLSLYSSSRLIRLSRCCSVAGNNYTKVCQKISSLVGFDAWLGFTKLSVSNTKGYQSVYMLYSFVITQFRYISSCSVTHGWFSHLGCPQEAPALRGHPQE